MNTYVIPSTLLLTVLLMVGLFFFVKASVKDRTEQVSLIAPIPEVALLSRLDQYFSQRAYRVVALDPEQVTFAGLVRPSLFLAVFLTLLVAAGMLCLALVLLTLVPKIGLGFLGLVLLAPLAGFFYWQRAGRQEQVLVKVEPLDPVENRSRLTVTAHRDELAALQQHLQLKPQD